jgi:4-hydroxybenzoate polyprenyltransferase
MSIGFILALGLMPAIDSLGKLVLAVVAWGILGNGGTLALNSAFDRDEGDIGYLENPPPVPKYLLHFALILLGSGMAVATLVSPGFVLVYGICMLLSLLYSVPPIRLKARAGWDILVNSVGYGGLTLYAGCAAAGRGLGQPIASVVAAFFCFFVGFYPLTQIYQMEEDSLRGDRTLALALGKRRSLQLACAGVIAGFIFLLVAVWQGSWNFRGIGLLVAMVAWGAVLCPWYSRWHVVNAAYEQRGFYLALYAWAVTDIAAALALMPVI